MDLPDDDMETDPTVKKEFEEKYENRSEAKEDKKESEKFDRCPFLSTSSFFKQFPVKFFYRVNEYLDVADLFRFAITSTLFYKEMDDDEFWAARFKTDLGEDQYKRAIFINTRNGWSTKHLLLWTLIGVAGEGEDEAQRFELQRDVWVCIMRERKRKALQLLSETQKSNETSASSISSSSPTTNSTQSVSNSASSLTDGLPSLEGPDVQIKKEENHQTGDGSKNGQVKVEEDTKNRRRKKKNIRKSARQLLHVDSNKQLSTS